ncbi:glycosyltransferase family 2 protein [Halorhodospira sp. 9622]|uniref:glycosyltransferase family 2 protein n=1 Tax=Halorhodospira sp. 9622 TaxID=2899136 RepID=UPI00351CD174
MPAPTCSIITPCHNSASYLGSAIGSVKSQSAADWELLLIDDGSTDSTPDICQAAQSADPRIQHIRLKQNSGPAIARNTGISAARGRYIFFLDSDDTWMPRKLARQVQAFEDSQAALCFSWYHVVDDSGSFLRTVQSPRNVSHRDFYRSCPVGCLTAGYDREKVGTIYMPELPMRQDWGLWLRVLEQHEVAVGIQEPLASLRVHKGSLTSNKLRASYYTWRLLREEAKLSRIKAGYGVCHHLLTAALRRIR